MQPMGGAPYVPQMAPAYVAPGYAPVAPGYVPVQPVMQPQPQFVAPPAGRAYGPGYPRRWTGNLFACFSCVTAVGCCHGL